MAIDVDKIVAGLNPSGIDPEIERKADTYGRQAWKMDFEPVLSKVMGEEFTEEFQAKLQSALFAHKVAVIEASQNRALENKELGKRW